MPRWRSPIRIRFLLVVGAVIAAAAAYIFGIAAYQAMGSRLFGASDLYIPRSIDVLIVAWCFWVGSSIGSFLNVVAWRMPRGEGINGRSHCPRCRAQLKARDNFPVFGWLGLGGRCRTCRLPIAARYPIVEGVVGLTITLISVSELYRMSLPRQYMHWHGGPFWAPVIDRPLLVTLLYHVVALATAWGQGLIRMDKHRLPGRIIVFGFVATLLPMLAYPHLMVVPWKMETPATWLPDGLYLDALARVITSLVAAIFLARILARGLCPTADPKLDPLGQSTARLIDLIAIIAIPTIIVGWHVSPALVVFASVLAVGFRRCLPESCDSLGRFAVAMPIALTIQIMFWRKLHSASLWPSDQSSPWVILAWGAVALMIPLWLRDSDGQGTRSGQHAEEHVDDDELRPESREQGNGPFETGRPSQEGSEESD